ncbi:MAG: hypothetical protein JNK85_28145 [Verrucomicrobiales bacterium]|nr:hypothetical protein [Verrucomicrobiales bacterium]
MRQNEELMSTSRWAHYREFGPEGVNREPGRSAWFDIDGTLWLRLAAMVRQCGIWFMVLALVVTTGGHWMILQMGAWTGMFVRFANESSMSEAVAKTFDGQHPCRLCHWVREGRSEQQKKATETLMVVAKLDLLFGRAEATVVPPRSEGRPAVFGRAWFPAQRRTSPPVPPPRAA